MRSKLLALLAVVAVLATAALATGVLTPECFAMDTGGFSGVLDNLDTFECR